MFSLQSLLVLASVAALSVASPTLRATGNSTTCDFIMTPTPDLGVDGLQVSINYAVGHTVGVQYPNTELTDDNSLVRHNDGTYDVHSIIAVSGQDGTSVGAFVETWEGTTLDGLQAKWYVGAANCY